MDEKDEGESVGGIEAVLKSVADTENEIFEFATHDLDLDASITEMAEKAIPVRYARSLEKEIDALERRVGLSRVQPEITNLHIYVEQPIRRGLAAWFKDLWRK